MATVNLTKKYDALYKCMKCEYEWVGINGPVVCPKCFHNHIKWVNYK